jgi:hypothetical protein
LTLCFWDAKYAIALIMVASVFALLLSKEIFRLTGNK